MQHRYSKLNLFTADGRLGRTAYIIFSIVMPAITFWILASTAGLIGKMGSFGESIGYALFLLTVLLTVGALLMLTIQRSHDFNTTGWLAALVLILPPMIILFWLMPGTNGINSYGEPPVKLAKWFKWASLALAAVLLIVTILAFANY